MWQALAGTWLSPYVSRPFLNLNIFSPQQRDRTSIPLQFFSLSPHSPSPHTWSLSRRHWMAPAISFDNPWFKILYHRRSSKRKKKFMFYFQDQLLILSMLKKSMDKKQLLKHNCHQLDPALNIPNNYHTSFLYVLIFNSTMVFINSMPPAPLQINRYRMFHPTVLLQTHTIFKPFSPCCNLLHQISSRLFIAHEQLQK